jgi:peroxiredoxin
METRVLRGAVRRALPVRLPVVPLPRSPAGGAAEEADVRMVARGRPTLVAFWSRFCGPSAAQLPALQRLTARLAAQGYGVVTVTDEPDGPGLRAFLRERGFTFPVYHDRARALRRALNQWGTPQLFVLDGDGRLRFEYTTPDDAPAQLALLRE